MFITLREMLPEDFITLASIMTVVLIITFMVTTIDSGVLVLTIIMSGGLIQTSPIHRIMWGIILALLAGSLMMVGGIDAVQKAMIIGALPFSMLMFLMCISVAKDAIGKWGDNCESKPVPKAETT